MARSSKRRPAGPRRRTGRRPVRRLVLRYLPGTLLICLAVSLAYLLRLDHIIQTRFQEHQWPLPARIYARPYDVFTGRQVTAAGFEQVLRESAYRSVAVASGAGEYHRSGETMDVVTRRFAYWDGVEESRRVRVRFSGGGIAALTSAGTGRPVPIFRIDPPLIARIYPETNEDRQVVHLDEVPRRLIEALLATEDRHFFEHHGVDIRGLLRAVWVDLVHAGIRQGGSTITQQLVKNLYLGHERTFIRKINEILMALLLERRYSKAQILESYINEVYLGQVGARGIHGFATAAEFYFRRPLDELDVARIATLVGLVRGASLYNPWRHPDRALARRNLVLQLMVEQGYLDARQQQQARQQPLGIADAPRWTQARYPAAVDVVRRQLQKDYRPEDLRSAGLQVFTTLDPELQDRVESIGRAVLLRIEKTRHLRPGTLETASVVVQVSSGEILAVTGGRRDGVGEFNRALDAQRPIGSLVKPVIYLEALSHPASFNLLSRLDDTAVALRQASGQTWRPGNYDGIPHGEVSMLEALTQSYNLATVHLGMALGLDRVATALERGIQTTVPRLPSLLLGAVDLSPYQVAQLYEPLANAGFLVPLNGIRDVMDRNDRALRRYGLKMRPAYDPRAVFLLDYLLARVPVDGTAHELGTLLAGRLPLAGKTGTTNDLRDSWFAGFGDDLLAVTWVGRDDNRPMGLTGATGAMYVWAAIMAAAGVQPLRLQPPDGISWLHDVQFRFRGECSELASLPYATDHVPASGQGC